MALVPRRIALAVLAVASIGASFVVPASSAYANSVPAPTLVSPADTTASPLKDVILQWNAVPGASLYEVQISPNGEWTNNTVTLPGGGQTVNDLFEVPISLPSGSYFWHVRAQVGGVWSSYSTAWQFLRDWPDNISILKAPTSADPTIEWAPISEASEYIVSFVDITDNNAEVDCTTEQTSFTPYVTVPSPTLSGTTVTGTPIPEDIGGTCFSESELVDGDSYMWGIEAYDDTTAPSISAEDQNGDPLACSAQIPVCSGYVGDTYVSPTPFTFLAPAGGDFDQTSTVTGMETTWHPARSANGTPCSTSSPCPVTPTFSWNPTPGANFYKVDVYLDPLHTNDYRTYTTAWPELTPRDFYLDAQAGANYYWTVQPGKCAAACSLIGTPKSCTAASNAGAPPSFGTVTEGTTTVDPFTDGFTAGETYTIELIDPSYPACVIPSTGAVTQYVNNTSAPDDSITFDWQAPPTAGTVTFEVVSQAGTNDTTSKITINAGTNLVLGVTSDPDTFAKRSGAVTLTSPVDGATLNGGSVTFKWDDFLTTGGDTALEAKNYEIQVSKDPSFDTTVIDENDVDLTQYTNPTNFLENGAYYWRVVAIDESGQLLTWSPTYHFTVDATSPTVSFVTGDGVGVGKPLSIQTSERLTDVTASTLKIVPEGKPASDAVAGKLLKGATSKLYTFVPDHPLGIGVTYVLVPLASLTDSDGNPVLVDGSGVRTALTAKSTSKAWTYSKGWSKSAASSALSGYVYSATAGRSASLTVGGAEATLYACIGPSFGDITVSVNGHSQTVSEHQSFTQCGVDIWHRSLPATSRKLTVSVVSGRGDIDEVHVDESSGSTTTTTTTG